MKRNFLICLAGLFLLISGSQAFAEKYLGEFCWQVFNEEREPYWSYKLGAYVKEGGHILLIGSVDYDVNGDSAAHGNAIIVGENIKVTINSGDDEEGTQVWSETFIAKLDRTTLNGAWNALALESNEGENEVRAVHNRGTIDLEACP